MKGQKVSVKNGGNPGIPHREIGDSVVDHLLLRHLPRCESDSV